MSEYPTPWTVKTGRLRPNCPTPIIEIHAVDGSVSFSWQCFDADGRSYAKRLRLARRVANAVNTAESASRLLERFVQMYGEVPLRGSMLEPGVTLWRDFYLWSGEHMIRTDEGWEPGEMKLSYEQTAKAEGLPLADFILEEVNAPKG